jgi:hypothetical protein
MYIFDPDHLSLIQRNGAEGKRILARLASIENIEVATHRNYLRRTGQRSPLCAGKGQNIGTEDLCL